MKNPTNSPVKRLATFVNACALCRFNEAFFLGLLVLLGRFFRGHEREPTLVRAP
jgi:hypothetical protein